MRRHRDELTRDLQIHPLPLLEIGQILVENERDGDVLNLYFVLAQQEKDEVQRALKVLERFAAPGLNDLFQLKNRVIQTCTPQKPTMRQNRV